MTNQAFEVIEKSLKGSHLPSNPTQADYQTLVMYRVWTNLSFLSGKRTSIRAYPLNPRERNITTFLFDLTKCFYNQIVFTSNLTEDKFSLLICFHSTDKKSEVL